LQSIVDRTGGFEARIDAPGITDFLGMAIYIIVIILLAAAQAISIVVIAYGFIATAVCVLVGPIFAPFFIVPKLEWLFWGWLRCFLQYAFYEVIAAAVVYIIGNLAENPAAEVKHFMFHEFRCLAQGGAIGGQ
jgi:hypothetical protein